MLPSIFASFTSNHKILWLCLEIILGCHSGERERERMRKNWLATCNGPELDQAHLVRRAHYLFINYFSAMGHGKVKQQHSTEP